MNRVVCLTEQFERNEIIKTPKNICVNDLLLDIFKKIEAENVIYSPVSLLFALGLLSLGANNETKIKLEEAFSAEIEDLSIALNNKLNLLTGIKGSTILKIGNSVWIDNNYKIKKLYLQKVADYYNGDIYSGVLSSDEVLDEVNSWVERNTKGLIKKLHEENYQASIKTILINTLYFKANWMTQFKKESTRKKVFRIDDKRTVKVDFMNMSEYLNYYEDKECQATILPYSDGRVEMILIKPKRGIKKVIEKIDNEFIKLISQTENYQYIKLSLPKFNVDFTINFKSLLAQTPLKIIFEDNADFTKISNDSLVVSDVLQKVKIIVDEAGTEAAAVTEIMLMKAMIPPASYLNLNFNKPFIYVIHDKKTNSILFIGTLDNPATKQE
jgi:serpin B